MCAKLHGNQVSPEWDTLVERRAGRALEATLPLISWLLCDVWCHYKRELAKVGKEPSCSKFFSTSPPIYTMQFFHHCLPWSLNRAQSQNDLLTLHSVLEGHHMALDVLKLNMLVKITCKIQMRNEEKLARSYASNVNDCWGTGSEIKTPFWTYSTLWYMSLRGKVGWQWHMCESTTAQVWWFTGASERSNFPTASNLVENVFFENVILNPRLSDHLKIWRASCWRMYQKSFSRSFLFSFVLTICTTKSKCEKKEHSLHKNAPAIFWGKKYWNPQQTLLDKRHNQ